MSVTPRGMSIQEAYREYRAGNLFVNRDYQRKLVWTAQEKQNLIDSVINNFPIPLFLFATKVEDNVKKFEILDGMQRLNALFTFIENHFKFNGKYFDVGQLARAKVLHDSGEIQAETSSDLLWDPSTCANFLDYTLAISEFPISDENYINEAFRRINSYGKQLSTQEKRQAGVLSPFAKVVRELAAEIRGDVSQDIINLMDMPSISINIEKREYGVNAEEIFWCNQGILRKSQLRDGEDEQFLADIIVSILEKTPFAFSKEHFDELYDEGSKRYETINQELNIAGAETLKHDVLATLSIMNETFDFSSNQNSLRQLVHPESGGNPIKSAFYAIFMAFYEMCINQEKTPENVQQIRNNLHNCHSKLNIAAGAIKSESRKQNIEVINGLISPYFIERTPPAYKSSQSMTIHFANCLRRSKIESAAYECKQGLVGLDNHRKLNTELLDRLIETTCGISNRGKNSEGAIFIGVADSQADVERIKSIDNITPVTISERYVVGIDRELNHLEMELESYKRLLITTFSKSKLSEPLKTYILSNLEIINYRNLSVVCIWIKGQETLSNLNDEIFIREGPNTIKVIGATKIIAISANFNNS